MAVIISDAPTMKPSRSPSVSPTRKPTLLPTSNPTSEPTGRPTSFPTSFPTALPTSRPSVSRPAVSPSNPPLAYSQQSSSSKRTQSLVVSIIVLRAVAVGLALVIFCHMTVYGGGVVSNPTCTHRPYNVLLPYPAAAYTAGTQYCQGNAPRTHLSLHTCEQPQIPER